MSQERKEEKAFSRAAQIRWNRRTKRRMVCGQEGRGGGELSEGLPYKEDSRSEGGGNENKGRKEEEIHKRR